MVALTALHQLMQGVAQAGEFANFLIQLFNMLAGQRFNIAAGALAVLSSPMDS